MQGIEATKNNTRITLVLALNYSAKWEILHAARTVWPNRRNKGSCKPADITEHVFENALSTRGIPDPGTAHPDQRGDPYFQFPTLADRVRRTVFHPRFLAGFW